MLDQPSIRLERAFSHYHGRVVSVDGNENKATFDLSKSIILPTNPVDDYYDFMGKLFEDLIVTPNIAFFEQKVVKRDRPLYLFPIDAQTKSQRRLDGI